MNFTQCNTQFTLSCVLSNLSLQIGRNVDLLSPKAVNSSLRVFSVCHPNVVTGILESILLKQSID